MRLASIVVMRSNGSIRRTREHPAASSVKMEQRSNASTLATRQRRPRAVTVDPGGISGMTALVLQSGGPGGIVESGRKVVGGGLAGRNICAPANAASSKILLTA